MNVYEPCLFNKYAVNEEAAVDGGTITPLEHGETPGSGSNKCGRWHQLLQDGPSFFGGRHCTQRPD